jgi:SAM-dependent methyltransferase
MLDLRFPLNCASDCWAGVFASHVLEHLYYDAAFQLLKEIYRTLKPGSWIRLVLPDLEKYVQFYNRDPAVREFHEYDYGAQAIHNLTQNWEHLSVWDFELLSGVLGAIGFESVARVSYCSGSDPRLFLDLEVRDWESFYTEARKPCV